MISWDWRYISDGVRSNSVREVHTHTHTKYLYIDVGMAQAIDIHGDSDGALQCIQREGNMEFHVGSVLTKRIVYTVYTRPHTSTYQYHNILSHSLSLLFPPLSLYWHLASRRTNEKTYLHLRTDQIEQWICL